MDGIGRRLRGRGAIGKVVKEMCDKYLTPEIKSKILKSLDISLSKGNVDTSITPYLTKINDITGVCSLSSCHGHYQGLDGKRTERNMGYIIIAVEWGVFKYLFCEGHIEDLEPYMIKINFDYLCRHIPYDGKGEYKTESLIIPAIRFDFYAFEWKKVLDKIIEVLRTR